MRFRGRRVVHVVMAAILVLTLLPNPVVSAQPPTPRNPGPGTSHPLTTNPSPPPNPLDINLLELLPAKEAPLPYKSGEANPVSISNNNGPINSPQISNGYTALTELNSANPISSKEPPVQVREEQASLAPQPSGYTEPTTDSQIVPNPLPILNLYELVSVEVTPDKEGILQSKDGKVKVILPAGAVTEKVRVEYKEQRPWESTGMRMVRLFELNGFAVDRGNAAVKTFSKQLQVSISHTKEELAGLDARSLRLYYLDETQKRWLPVTGQYNTTTRTLTSSTDHFTYYGEQANPTISGPGLVMGFQVGLQSGTAVARYPIELPPGPGGFQPNLELTYNSGGVDEMKNKRDLGSWVGIGWSLHPGRISYDGEFGSYRMEIGGAGYEIISADGTTYYTRPDTFFKITRSWQTWEAYDRNGTYYRFGGTTDSEQSIQNYDYYYRWDLSLVRDIHGNQMTASYVRDVISNEVRSAYPQYLRYNFDSSNNALVEVYFHSTNDQQDPTDGPIRNDNPRSTQANPAPKVMENRKLEYIEVRAGNPLSLVRKYSFSYVTTASQSSIEYSGIYYSGTHKLTSITQIGTGGQTLPAMTFTSVDRDIYFNDTYVLPYTGNPGNPARLTRPYLNAVTNGYGATVTFDYTGKPPETSNYIWTRQVVTGRTVNPVLGPVQTYSYAYYDQSGNPTDNPRYMGNGWKARFVGFDQVKEADAAGNYVWHYFYTTGQASDGKDAARLTGREYKTEWWEPGPPAKLLKRVAYDWTWRTTQTNKYAFVSQFSGPDNGRIGRPRGIAVDEDYVYVVDMTPPAGSNVVRKFDPYGAQVLSWGTYGGTGDGQFGFANGIDVRGGAVYVTDYVNNRIQVFLTNGAFSFKWGASGQGPGQFSSPEDVGIISTGLVYVVDSGNNRIQRFDPSGTYISQWAVTYPQGIAVDGNNNLFVTRTEINIMEKFNADGVSLGSWNYGPFSWPRGVAVDSNGYVYVMAEQSNNRVQKFTNSGSYVTGFGSSGSGFGGPEYPRGVAVRSNGDVYVTDDFSRTVQRFAELWAVDLSQVDETTYSFSSGSKTSQTKYIYDTYGNVVKTERYGDTSASGDESTVYTVFYPNTTAWIVNKPARERVYTTNMASDDGGANLKKETLFYYDGNNTSNTTPPTKGDLTRLEAKKDATSSVSTYYTYDTYGNRLTETDPRGNTTAFTYDATNRALPVTKTLPLIGSESYTWDYGAGRILTETDVNGQVTSVEYDTFKRPIKIIRPGDSSGSPTIQHEYLNWGTLNQQHVKTTRKIDAGNSLWSKRYFDGLGRVVQAQSQGETEGGTAYTIVNSTTAFNNRGLADKEYLSQKLAASGVTQYVTPDGAWKYTSYVYDGLNRATQTTKPDSTTVSHDYTIPWQDTATNERGKQKKYYSDAFGRLVKVEELNDSQAVYATTNYTYDALDNLQTVTDALSNVTTINYDWLSRKTSMTDPDMGTWSYAYDASSNLLTQTDAKGQTINFTYDALNRLTCKSSSASCGGTIYASYSYDSVAGGNYGKGRRTGMADGSGSAAYTYDTRGRPITEQKTVTGDAAYTTQYTYDSADRLNTITYPGGEVVTQGYNGRGLPYSLSSGVSGTIVSTSLYNQLGQPTEINLGNTSKISFGYWGMGGMYDATGGYYSKLWETKTFKTGLTLQDVQHTWDQGGNLAVRLDLMQGGKETFTYDFLDRLTQSTVSTNFVLATGSYGTGDGQFQYATRVTTDSSGNVYAVDQNNHRIQKFDATGKFITKWGAQGSGDGQFNGPRGIAVDSSGNVYVADENNHRIQKFSSTGTFITKWGTQGSGDGQLINPHDVAVDSSGNVYVADTYNHRIQKFTNTGTFVTKWGTYGTGDGQFTNPKGLGIDSSNNIYIADTTNHRVQKFNSTGGFVGKFGTNGSSDGQFQYPLDVAVDSVGNIFVADRDNSRIQKFNSSYTFLAKWGSWGSGEGQFIAPEGVTVDSLGNIYVADLGNNRLQKFIDPASTYTENVSFADPSGKIGNITSKGGQSYTYGNKPHAVTAVGGTSYAYDANGNMTTRGSQSLTWDVENRLTGVTGSASFVYDGDGKRVKKVEGGTTTVYVNRYYEKKIGTPDEITLYYYLGDRLVALKKGTNLRYVSQDHLTDTALTTDTAGELVAKTTYFPFGSARSSTGTIETEKKFTGQRLDGSTGLYLMQSSAPVWTVDAPAAALSAPLTVSAWWAGRYYDPPIGRFTQADTIVPYPGNPQALNRYSYVANNPLKYVDPSGHFWDWIPDALTLAFDVYQLILDPSEENANNLRVDMVLAATPFVPAGVGPLKAAGRAIDRAEQIARNAETGRQFQRAAGRAVEAKGITLGRPVSRVTSSGDKVILDFFSNKLVAYEAKHIDWTAKSYQKTKAGDLNGNLSGKLKSIAKQVKEQKGALDTAKGETHGGVILNRPDDAKIVKDVEDFFTGEHITVMWID